MKQFGERVRKLLEEKKMSQSELAALSGVAASSLCRYLRDENEPRVDIIRNVARALGVSEAYLLGLSDEDRVIDERQELKKMVARNRHILTKDDKSEIIALLYGEDDV